MPRITNKLRKQVAAGEIPGLSGDISGLSGDISGLSGDISSGLRGYISGLSGDISSGLSGDISSGLRGDISGLRGDISGLRGYISSGLRGDISGLRGYISGLSGDISGLSGDISGLRGDISGLRGDISGLRGDILAGKYYPGVAYVEADEDEIKRLDEVREIVLAKPKRLEMRRWHSPKWTPDHTPEEEHGCGSAHCIAGWLQALSPDKDIRLLKPSEAGCKLAPASSYMFYTDNATALRWLKDRVYDPATHVLEAE